MCERIIQESSTTTLLHTRSTPFAQFKLPVESAAWLDSASPARKPWTQLHINNGIGCVCCHCWAKKSASPSVPSTILHFLPFSPRFLYRSTSTFLFSSCHFDFFPIDLAIICIGFVNFFAYSHFVEKLFHICSGCSRCVPRKKCMGNWFRRTFARYNLQRERERALKRYSVDDKMPPIQFVHRKHIDIPYRKGSAWPLQLPSCFVACHLCDFATHKLQFAVSWM